MRLRLFCCCCPFYHHHHRRLATGSLAYKNAGIGMGTNWLTADLCASSCILFALRWPLSNPFQPLKSNPSQFVRVWHSFPQPLSQCLLAHDLFWFGFVFMFLFSWLVIVCWRAECAGMEVKLWSPLVSHVGRCQPASIG